MASVIFTFDPAKTDSPPEFYVGVEFAYGRNLNDSQTTFTDLKMLVDKVSNYTNLFVVGIPEVSKNQALLNDSCNYIYNAGLHFIVLFTDITTYNYTVGDWTAMAHQKYGEKFLGVYRLDEPGGIELDNHKDRFLNASEFSADNRNYTGAAETYINALGGHVNYFHSLLYPTIVTADYGLYWFDYKSGYDTVFAEFGWNQSRQIAISLCRGAARAQNKDWGAMITWTYRQEPYIESGPELYGDLVLAYDSGAKYAVVFDYPNPAEYGILTPEHFKALSDFWNYTQANPQKHGSTLAQVAYVLPEGYGFGFRSANDSIWGIWNADNLAVKVWSDTRNLISQYGSGLDVVYSDAQYMHTVKGGYSQLFYWNQTIP